MSSPAIDWPPRLLDTVKQHLEAVDNAVCPMIPPLFTPGTMTIYDFFSTQQETLAARLAGRGVSADTVEFCVGFTIEVLEHACQLSFFTPKERRTIGLAVRQMNKRAAPAKSRAAGRGGVADGKRRRSGGPEADSSHEGAQYCRVLTLEYLLRFFIALPLIVEHYDRLGGSEIPGFSKRPLWEFAGETLRLLDSMRGQFSPLMSYIPVK